MVLFDEAYWTSIINFDGLLRHGMIAEGDLDLFCFAETAEEVWAKLLERGVKPHEEVT